MIDPVAAAALPAFAVAIPTYQRGDSLVQVIADVLDQVPQPDEILVVDQTADHDPVTQQRLQAWADAGVIRWLHLAVPNLPAARNRALAETRCPIVVFFDDDVRLHPGCLAAHLLHFVDPAVAGVSGRVRQPPETRPRRRRRPVREDSRYLDFDFDHDLPRTGLARFSGCNHAVRVSALLACGGYDEHFTGSGLYEDVDAGLRVARAGGEIRYAPAAVLDHLLKPAGGSRASGGRPEAVVIEERMYLSLYFLAKNFFPRLHFWSRFFYRYPRRYIFNRASLRQPGQVPGLVWRYLRSARRALSLARAS